jgi:peptide/nickel transport system permease protein
MLSRLVHGARLSLATALTATIGVTLLGLGLGLVAGMLGRFADTAVLRVVDVLQAIPTLVLALVVVGLLGRGTVNLVLAIVLVGWTGYARFVRAMALRVRENDFVEAARALGATTSRVVLRHVAPKLLGPVIVMSTLDLGRILLAVSGLSFLGLGVAPPTPEWGPVLAEAREYLPTAPQLLLYPGLAITVLVLAVNLAGDALRNRLDPRATYDLLPPRRGGA